MSEVENKPAEAAAPVAKIDAAAEKAYAEAAAKVADAPKAKAEAAPAPAEPAAPVRKAAPLKKAAASRKAAPKKAMVRKPVAKKSPASKAPAKAPVLAKKAAAKPAAPAPATTTANPVAKLKDTIMTTAKKIDLTASAKEMLADVQARAKTAFAKTGELAAEATEFTKANVEAVVESGKIFVTGAQELLKDNIETGKTVIETVTEDAKKVAAVKSPTELFQLQGELARRNFDALVAYGSKRTEAWLKLYNDAFAPISNRVSVATEKLTKAA
jgi:phasin family protein